MHEYLRHCYIEVSARNQTRAKSDILDGKVDICTNARSSIEHAVADCISERAFSLLASGLVKIRGCLSDNFAAESVERLSELQNLVLKSLV